MRACGQEDRARGTASAPSADLRPAVQRVEKVPRCNEEGAGPEAGRVPREVRSGLGAEG